MLNSTYAGYLQSNQDKYKRLMKVLGDCHIEKQREDSDKASAYCTEDKNFCEYGEYQFIAEIENVRGQTMRGLGI